VCTQGSNIEEAAPISKLSRIEAKFTGFGYYCGTFILSSNQNEMKRTDKQVHRETDEQMHLERENEC